MKKIIYFILFASIIASCKFDDQSYSIIREFDSGTYITPDGKVKYISGTADSLVSVSDNYAVIQENITYVKKNADGMLSDSILIYGHVYSKSPNPVVCGYDSVNKIDLMARLATNSNIYFNGNTEPESFITSADLDRGLTFRSGFGLHYETPYYVRSFVITGNLDGGKPEYKDIAYNQNTLQFTTDSPVDLWVGGTMQEAPMDFPDNEFRNGTSFTYNGYLFVTQGRDEGPLETQIVIERYDPVSNTWDEPYRTLPISPSFTGAVSFVIEKVDIGNNIKHDCVFIGLGITDNPDETNVEFYRLDLEKNLDEPEGNWGEWVNITSSFDAESFPGIGVQDAVAFSINGIGYVGLGATGDASQNTPNAWFFKYDPSDRDLGHAYGKWTKIQDFPGGPRTKAVCFKLGDNVYISCGMNDNGDYKNDLWMCSQSTGDNLIWKQRAPFPGTPRIDAVAMSIGENGYIGTGRDADSIRSDFWRYNPFLNKWDQRRNFGNVTENDPFNGGLPRYEAVGAGIKINDNDFRGYIGTGWNGTAYFNDFWHYRP